MRFKGWKQIFGFNYVQYIKTKAFIASTIVMAVIFALIIAGVNIIPSLMEKGGFDGIFGGGEDDPQLEKLYICNETDIAFVNLSYLESYNIETEELSRKDFDRISEEIAKGEKAYAALLISKAEYESEYEEEEGFYYDLKLYRPENEDVLSQSECEGIAEACRDGFKNSILLSLGVDENELETAKLEVNAETFVFGEEENSAIKEIVGVVIPMVISALMFSFIVTYAQIIAQSIAQEKTSRVIELLITSVRPLAIITGKVLAMLLVAITQVAAIGSVCGIVSVITMPFAASANSDVTGGAAAAAGDGVGAGTDTISEIMNVMPGLFNPGSIIAIIITLILGFLFYALLAGLVGAGVSRIEDLAASLQPLMMIAMLGFFLSYMSAAFNEDGSGNIVMTISRYIPISSPFSLPPAILLGQMSASETVISVAFLALLTALTVLLVSKVYETIILYSGNPLKLGQILKMAKNKDN